jgi:hypothetical protein
VSEENDRSRAKRVWCRESLVIDKRTLRVVDAGNGFDKIAESSKTVRLSANEFRALIIQAIEQRLRGSGSR